VRKLIIAMSALAVAAPAAAQPPRPDPRDEALVRRIPPPEQIERMGDAIARVTDALMDIDIGPIVDAIDPAARRYRRGPETLGDLATRGDPYARERIRDEVGAATVGLGAAAEQMKVVTPVIRQSIEDAAARMEEAMERSRERIRRDRTRDHDRDGRD
jgi:hypothetical protein